jgi:hypothetical protein
VSRTLTREVVSLHDTGEATSLTGPRDIHSLDLNKLIDRDRGPYLKLGLAAKLANEPLRFTTRLINQLDSRGRTVLGTFTVKFGNMTAFTAARQTTRLILETHLNSLIAIAIFTANLQDMTGTCLDHRHRHSPTVFQVNLCHPDFAAED